jgi:hypothetical protein
MKRSLFFILFIWAGCAIGALSQASAPPLNAVHVATALNHLTVLEFHEPVTMAAAGSSDFQIERQEDKVFIKPTKSGISTDLFVWTASRRFAYELETTGVKNMNVSVDNPLPTALPDSGFSAHVDEFADMMLTRAFLGAVDIAPANARVPKSQVRVRIQQVFRTKTSIYVHYSIENDSRSRSTYHVTPPDVFELQAGQANLSLPSFAHKQLDPRLLENLSDVHTVSLPVPHAETASEDLAPGESTEGVVAIRQDLRSPAVVQLVFDSQVKATFVL